jgi:hypothetical protein
MKSEVRWTIPLNPFDDLSAPYMPRKFPVGEWEVYRPISKTQRVYAPFFIPTNAFQRVQLWEVDSNGGYDHPIQEYQTDAGYGIHFSETSRTTLGCIRLDSAKDAEVIAGLVNYAMDRKEKVLLEVRNGERKIPGT